MKFLPEYVLLQEALLRAAEDTFQLAYLRDFVLRDGLLRDLRGGRWSKSFWEQRGSAALVAKGFVKALKTNHRLLSFRNVLETHPACDDDWCAEAIASHRERTLDAIIATGEVAERFLEKVPSVIAFDKLPDFGLSNPSTESLSVPFRMDEYLKHLALVLSAARRLCFIDPYIDPAHRDYSDFPRLLLAAGRRSDPPRLEIHRRCSYKFLHETEKAITSESTWREVFAPWDRTLASEGVKARVIIWDSFKLRFFLSDLLGLQIGKGFKTNRDTNEKNMWGRLSRIDREEVDRDFDLLNSPTHKLYCDFYIGKQ